MAQGRSRPAWAEIDLAAVTHNAAVLARLAAPAELCAVVKAHGYGHGGPAVARAALAGGATPPGRGTGRRGGGAARARRHRAGAAAERVRPRRRRRRRWPTASRRRCTRRGRSRPSRPPHGAAGRRPVAVHVKVDTGMHRVGAAPEELARIVAAVRGEPVLRARGRVDAPARRRRRRRRRPRVHRGPARPLRPPGGRPGRAGRDGAAAARRQHGRHHRLPPARATTWSAAGSASTATCPGRRCRPPSTTQAGGEQLRPAMSLKAQVVAVRTLDAGERPSYGRLRPLPDALARGHRADRLRRRRAPRPLRRRLRGPHRRACAGRWPGW